MFGQNCAANVHHRNEAGERLAVCVHEAGGGSQTKIHGVGDGAVWIREQKEEQFGAQGQYLVDFYHLCDYLAAAGEVIAGQEKSAWMEEKKNWLKENRWPEVLESLQPFLEEPSVDDAQAPVRACFRYICNRSSYLDYKSALAAGLPHRFGGDRECPPLYHAKTTEDFWSLVEGRKPEQDAGSSSGASEPRLGTVLEERAAGGGACAA